MPRQNRVTPFSTLVAAPARGTLMGNRGCLHDAHGRIRRPFQGQRWIICLLDFKGRRRPIMKPGHYTELFFLDEATALAAGHRPCAECQRVRFRLFRDLWAAANPDLAGGELPAAPALDACLHQERCGADGWLLDSRSALENLPDGTFVTGDERTACLAWEGRWLRWRPSGYAALTDPVFQYPLRVLTPPSVVRTLAAGYPVRVHPSAHRPPADPAQGQVF